MDSLHLDAWQAWLLPAFLGLGLAAATGLRTFLPITLLAAAAHFGLMGEGLNPHIAWLASTPFLIGLSVATVAELAADKIPVVDHALSAIGTVTRPVAAAVAAGSVFARLDPGTAALAGLIIGVPTALAFHGLQTSTRLVSTATTAGLGNPAVSLAEDFASGGLAILAIAFPVVAALVVAGLFWGLWRLTRVFRRRAKPAAASETVSPDGP